MEATLLMACREVRRTAYLGVVWFCGVEVWACGAEVG